jgi:hypothetical protein
MKPHEIRVVEEKSELDGKRAKLAAFIGTEFEQSLPQEERQRLRIQLDTMRWYSEVLGDRIEWFKKSANDIAERTAGETNNTNAKS